MPTQIGRGVVVCLGAGVMIAWLAGTVGCSKDSQPASGSSSTALASPSPTEVGSPVETEAEAPPGQYGVPNEKQFRDPVAESGRTAGEMIQDAGEELFELMPNAAYPAYLHFKDWSKKLSGVPFQVSPEGEAVLRQVITRLSSRLEDASQLNASITEIEQHILNNKEAVFRQLKANGALTPSEKERFASIRGEAEPIQGYRLIVSASTNFVEETTPEAYFIQSITKNLNVDELTVGDLFRTLVAIRCCQQVFEEWPRRRELSAAYLTYWDSFMFEGERSMASLYKPLSERPSASRRTEAFALASLYGGNAAFLVRRHDRTYSPVIWSEGHGIVQQQLAQDAGLLVFNLKNHIKGYPWPWKLRTETWPLDLAKGKAEWSEPASVIAAQQDRIFSKASVRSFIKLIPAEPFSRYSDEHPFANNRELKDPVVTLDLGKGVSMRFVRIEPPKPKHQFMPSGQAQGPYYMSVSPVTVLQYQRCEEEWFEKEMRSLADEEAHIPVRNTHEESVRDDILNPLISVTGPPDKRPVVSVAPVDVWQFLRWMSFRSNMHCRLPSAEEWDHASRVAGSGSPAMLAMYKENEGGSLPALQHVIGDLWEFCTGLYGHPDAIKVNHIFPEATDITTRTRGIRKREFFNSETTFRVCIPTY